MQGKGRAEHAYREEIIRGKQEDERRDDRRGEGLDNDITSRGEAVEAHRHRGEEECRTY